MQHLRQDMKEISQARDAILKAKNLQERVAIHCLHALTWLSVSVLLIQKLDKQAFARERERARIEHRDFCIRELNDTNVTL